MTYLLSAGDEEGSEAGVCFVMRYIKAEPAGSDVHIWSDRWRLMLPRWHKM